jgi:sphingolipid delta-4 desaturase
VTKALLARHPEIRQLIGHNPWSALFTLLIVAAQSAVAFALSRLHADWWLILLLAWTAGAVADHALWVMIHEATHNLMFRNRRLNQATGLLANLPLIVPGHFSFQRYHLRHHAYQGEYEHDADLAAMLEARLIGHRTLSKALWLLLFPFVQGLRPLHLKPRDFLDATVVTNWITQLAYVLLMWYAGGWIAVGYLVAAMFFSIGLHPLGARWIQEHYTLTPEQETYSYYGPANLVAFNVGFHNEHHDFPSIPWNRLPRVRAIASEHYGLLKSYRSWTMVLLRFLTDGRYSLYARVVRPSRVVSSGAWQGASRAAR